MSEIKEAEKPPVKPDKDACPKCGSTKTYLVKTGMTGMCGDIYCSNCNKRLRMWDAY